ncbi:MAG: hypothetical protein AB8C13_09480 [Phycisphaerales bacterium]
MLQVNSGPDVDGTYSVIVKNSVFSDIVSEDPLYVYRGSATPACQPDFNDDGNLNFIGISIFPQEFGEGFP